MAYRLQLSPAARTHLAGLPKHWQRAVADAVRNQLAYEPARQTRNRFPLRPNDRATWELRVDAQRVH